MAIPVDTFLLRADLHLSSHQACLQNGWAEYWYCASLCPQLRTKNADPHSPDKP